MLATHIYLSSLQVQVLAIGLQRKPLLPGTLLPAQVHSQRVINEILDLQRDGYFLNFPSLFGILANNVCFQLNIS